jgi:SpoVK/Ycf46/Vps4 family AAA+-type ATPase
MVRLDGYKLFNNIRNEERIFELLGSEPEGLDSDSCGRNYSNEFRPQLKKYFEQKLQMAEKNSAKTKLPKVLSGNIEKLAGIANLDKDEKTVLAFCILVQSYEILESCVDVFSDVQTNGVAHILSRILDMNPQTIKKILSSESRLCKTGLISIEKDKDNISRKLTLLSRGFADKMVSSESDIFELVKDSVRKCDDGKLCLDDYEQIKEHTEILLPYLKNSIAKSKMGVNILIYGKPGTGKSEYVKALSREFGYQLAEITFADADEEPIKADERLKALKVAQTFFAKQKSILMLDEAEDVFTLSDGNIFNFGNRRQENKAWMNRALEQNQIPTFWISNSIYGLDEAVLRRFDMVIEMPMPSRKKRKELIEKECGKLITPMIAEDLANCESLSPAILNKAVSVLKDLGEMPVEKSSKAMELLIDSTMSAQGRTFVKNSTANTTSMKYAPELINTDSSLVNIRDGIKNSNSARVCLYGPPGTGKSAFGKWIADELNRPLLLKKASDLISMYVGGTEKNIASAFREAMEDEAVLVIDEVDSFLQDRRGAQRSWEVTAVNEMLVQMENFTGVFIATTNLMDGLDQASLRRFDLKLKFDYLSSEQAWSMFMRGCEVLNMKKPNASLKAELNNLSNLTPGDFAAIARQARFNPLKDARDLLERLAKECEVKEDANSNIKMGFLR